MTPNEISIAYDGYLTRLELQGNVMLMAIRESFEKKAKPIKLRENKQAGKSDAAVHKSNIECREETFKALGIPSK